MNTVGRSVGSRFRARFNSIWYLCVVVILQILPYGNSLSLQRIIHIGRNTGAHFVRKLCGDVGSGYVSLMKR